MTYSIVVEGGLTYDLLLHLHDLLPSNDTPLSIDHPLLPGYDICSTLTLSVVFDLSFFWFGSKSVVLRDPLKVDLVKDVWMFFLSKPILNNIPVKLGSVRSDFYTSILPTEVHPATHPEMVTKHLSYITDLSLWHLIQIIRTPKWRGDSIYSVCVGGKML